ncbi:hypothetical protein AB0I10_39220 [Streptomyces sp. NPDC050636]|uniref:hypothetical protein n=1 Tax=Streptomyces sp. NPDC050636 TaxID=3154510 RepID=UPI0034289539
MAERARYVSAHRARADSPGVTHVTGTGVSANPQHTPVYLDRAGDSALDIPDEHREWFEAERFERLAQGLEAFFLERLATAAYARIALVDDEMVEYDDWLRLLRQAGLTA